MDNTQIIVALFTLSSWALTFISMYRYHIKWYFAIPPAGIGFTTCLWMALILG